MTLSPKSLKRSLSLSAIPAGTSIMSPSWLMLRNSRLGEKGVSLDKTQMLILGEGRMGGRAMRMKSYRMEMMGR